MLLWIYMSVADGSNAAGGFAMDAFYTISLAEIPLVAKVEG